MDILERKDLHDNPFKVPGGYFSKLEQRLSAIPSAPQAETGKWQVLQNIRPVFTLAACFAAALVAGSLFLRNTSSEQPEILSYEQYSSLDLIPYTLDESQMYISEASSNEDLFDYMIDAQIIY